MGCKQTTIYNCDICHQEFDRKDLWHIELPVKQVNEYEIELNKNVSFLSSHVAMKKLDICDECLTKSTNIILENDKYKLE